MRGDGPKHGPDIGGRLLEADGEPLKHCVERESQHREEVSGEQTVFEILHYKVVFNRKCTDSGDASVIGGAMLAIQSWWW